MDYTDACMLAYIIVSAVQYGCMHVSLKGACSYKVLYYTVQGEGEYCENSHWSIQVEILMYYNSN